LSLARVFRQRLVSVWFSWLIRPFFWDSHQNIRIVVLSRHKAKATVVVYGLAMRVRVPHEDLFPIELLEYRVQASIREHFGGRCPSISEMANIPDDELLKLPGIGATTIRKIRLLIQGEIQPFSAMTELSDAELLQEHERQLTRLNELRDESNRREGEFRRRLRALRLELRVRGLSPK
jgi:hypothetical protein